MKKFEPKVNYGLVACVEKNGKTAHFEWNRRYSCTTLALFIDSVVQSIRIAVT